LPGKEIAILTHDGAFSMRSKPKIGKKRSQALEPFSIFLLRHRRVIEYKLNFSQQMDFSQAFFFTILPLGCIQMK